MQAVDHGLAVPIVLFILIFGILALKILAGSFTRIVCHWRDVSLKMQMVEAGFSPAEIERVVQTGTRRVDEHDKAPAKHALAK